ncbi:MAG TPA: proteasome assembly chaperone family protein [Candidatus Baltobacteraceae bacterium]|nr:proteasome assembly chaperone family protein [Candidatus Baltobacteraceae bacterium]
MAIDKTVIRVRKGTKPNKPILVVGLPGIGNVGKLVAEHLKKELKAKRIATLYSPHFPHQVLMLKSGTVRIVSNRFYLAKSPKKGGSDIIILTGDTQAVSPEGQYEVNTKIVNFFNRRLNGSFIYTIGGYNLGEPIAKEPRVFGNATSAAVIKQFKGTNVIFGKSRGIIWGSAGLIIGFAKMKKMDGICMMGEVGPFDIDAAAAKAVITTLSKKLGLEIHTQNLDKMIEQTAKLVREIEKQAGMPAQLESGPSGPSSDNRPSYIR